MFTKNDTPENMSTANSQKDEKRVPTNIEEFDRVLGGGLIPGGVIFLAGHPGAGKSSLLAGVSQELGIQGRTVLYVSGEENKTQIMTRHRRVKATSDNIYVLCEMNADNISEHIQTLKPDFMIFDSAQTIISSRSQSKAGSASQVIEVVSEFIALAKDTNTPAIIIGHVTKNDDIAGPKQVEHLVDTVMVLEASTDTPLRILRATKNRYGAVDEVGLFMHEDDGLKEVKDPTGFFTHPHQDGVSGYGVSIMIEGMRAMPIEVQALCTPTTLSNPRKLTHGLEHSRALMIQAILEKHGGVPLNDKDVYVSSAGGVSVKDSSLDLAIAAALISSVYDVEPEPNTVYIGELSLTGEVRPARHEARRVKEAKRLNMTPVTHDQVGTVNELVQRLRARMAF